MMNFSPSVRVCVLALLVIVASAAAASADSGIKFGPTFPQFSSDVLDFSNRTGWQGGLFLGGKGSTLGFQTEINWVRKNAEVEGSARKIRIDYLQIPGLLRVNAGPAFVLGGPAVDIKIADEIEGFTLDEGINDIDVSLVLSGGVELARFIVEGRYTKGLRQINNLFQDFTEIKTQSFTLLFGLRFN